MTKLWALAGSIDTKEDFWYFFHDERAVFFNEEDAFFSILSTTWSHMTNGCGKYLNPFIDKNHYIERIKTYISLDLTLGLSGFRPSLTILNEKFTVL